MASIYDYFADREELPVELDDVITVAVECGGASKYHLYPDDLDRTNEQAHCIEYDIVDDPDFRVAEIYYSVALRESDPYYWRVVCCKEILHTLENGHLKAESRHAVERLFQDIAARPELHQMLPSTRWDFLGEYAALLILIPEKARNILKVKYQADELTVAKISEYTKVPQRFVRLVLADDWDQIIDILKAGIEESEREI